MSDIESLSTLSDSPDFDLDKQIEALKRETNNKFQGIVKEFNDELDLKFDEISEVLKEYHAKNTKYKKTLLSEK